MSGMRIGSANSGELTITSRMFHTVERLRMRSRPDARFPAQASCTLSNSTRSFFSPPCDAMPDSSRQPSMNDNPM